MRGNACEDVRSNGLRARCSSVTGVMVGATGMQRDRDKWLVAAAS
jgi:hypothetical protein